MVSDSGPGEGNEESGGRHRLDGGGPPTVPEERMDTVFRALAHRHRRCLVGYLIGMPDATCTVDDLVDHLATVTGREPERLRTALYHKHLPSLAAIGVVEYDPRSQTVRYDGQPLLEDLLARANEDSELPYRPDHSSEFGFDTDGADEG